MKKKARFSLFFLLLLLIGGSMQAQKAQKIHAPVHHIEHGVFHPHAFRVGLENIVKA